MLATYRRSACARFSCACRPVEGITLSFAGRIAWERVARALAPSFTSISGGGRRISCAVRDAADPRIHVLTRSLLKFSKSPP